MNLQITTKREAYYLGTVPESMMVPGFWNTAGEMDNGCRRVYVARRKKWKLAGTLLTSAKSFLKKPHAFPFLFSLFLFSPGSPSDYNDLPVIFHTEEDRNLDLSWGGVRTDHPTMIILPTWRDSLLLLHLLPKTSVDGC
nr:hypothetical protein Iba_chr07fCG12330 [Ipomoea batatas]GMD21251.1 hypothetical protein Iba_chr07fCG12340 [Ipomoea batatas]